MRDFLDPLRRSAFEEVRAAGMISSRGLRALLTARMMNRGFPGFDLDQLLSPKPADAAEIEQLFESTLLLLKLEGTGGSLPPASEADAQD